MSDSKQNPPARQRFNAENVAIEFRWREEGSQLVLDFSVTSAEECLLHWGLSRQANGRWQAPPASTWPPGSRASGASAVQSPCVSSDQQSCTLSIRLDRPCAWDNLPFVLYLPRRDRWLKNGREDFRARLPGSDGRRSPREALEATTDSSDWQYREFDLGDGECLVAALAHQEADWRILLATDVQPPLLMHWGLAGRFRHQWRKPPAEIWPEGTTEFDNLAVRTPFQQREGLAWLEIRLPRPETEPAYLGINFVLFQSETGRWIKTKGQDLRLPLGEPEDADQTLASERVRELAERIVEAEMGKGSWTLMHRFNLCHDLLDGAAEDNEALALLFAWLRFSAIRQLDWQRNYNTQPRELSHSQERLTSRLADIYRHQAAASRPWTRLILSTLGRGGEGQKVRDEILNIMHRHHIKEVHGHFLEEWHQKLHNNTTPDDIVICEAYLAFLHGSGDVGQFYDTLSRGGIDRERLRGFERPIRTDPEFYPDKRDGLIHDFEYFLGILKSVHSGTDFDTAAAAARGVLGDQLNHQLNDLYHQRQGLAPLRTQVEGITQLREALAERIRSTSDTLAVREMLYLDLALEQLLRGAIEQQSDDGRDLQALVALAWLVLRSLALDPNGEEFRLCARQLGSLTEKPANDRDWALQVKSVTDRASRAVAAWSETLYATLQPKAEYLGEAFAADAWTLPLFSEEIIRGGAGFMLSLLLRRLDPPLRHQAGLGGWQVISPAHAAGRAEVVASLRSVQGKAFRGPTVLISDEVAGDEEIPEGVTSVITSDSPDLVSHVAVRARNAQVLFATCFDDTQFAQLKELRGKNLALDVSPGGDVAFAETELDAAPKDKRSDNLGIRRRVFTSWAVGHADFDPQVVGGKSNNLTALRGRLAAWIEFPTSIALPFGVFERSLASAENLELAAQLQRLQAEAAERPERRLSEIRELVQRMTPPAELRDALTGAWRSADLPQVGWQGIWQSVTKVWASKWNERAWYSRIARGIDHDDLMMAVLIQQVVAADYAYVIHTVNPITGSREELFAEVVPGLGETLVGNHPGRALGFVCRKSDLRIELLSYPGKSLALYGSGVIFRSDSNGEDLEGFAGAGLYDSFLADPPEARLLDYTREPLVQDREFRQRLLQKIARIGLEVEAACGSAQDIEGALQGDAYYLLQTRPQVGLSEAS